MNRLQGERIIYMDAGARNGMRDLASIAEYVSAFGFEPNPEEYKKIVGHCTDNPTPRPKYHDAWYGNLALGDRTSIEEFYVTPGPGACGLRVPLEELNEIGYKGRPFRRSFGEDIFGDPQKIRVKVMRLDEWVGQWQLRHVDYFKIDVEGSAYEVLVGAGALLDTMGLIKCEVEFTPFREGQKLFSDVDLLLRGRGWRLLNYQIHPMQIGYKLRHGPSRFVPEDYPDMRGQLLQADAIYINRNYARPWVLSAMLKDLGYWDEAAFVIKDVRTSDDEAYFSELIRGQEPMALGYRVKHQGYRAVEKVIHAGRR